MAFQYLSHAKPERDRPSWSEFRELHSGLNRVDLLNHWLRTAFLQSSLSADEIVGAQHSHREAVLKTISEVREHLEQAPLFQREISRRAGLLNEGSREVALLKPIYEIKRHNTDRGDLYGVSFRGPLRDSQTMEITWSFRLECRLDAKLLRDPGDIAQHQIGMWNRFAEIAERPSLSPGYDGWLKDGYESGSKISAQKRADIMNNLIKSDSILDLYGREFYLISEPANELRYTLDLRSHSAGGSFIRAHAYLSAPSLQDWGYDIRNDQCFNWLGLPGSEEAERRLPRISDRSIFRALSSDLLEWAHGAIPGE